MDPLTLFALANGAVAAVKKGCQLYKDVKSAAGDVKAVLKDLDEQFHKNTAGKPVSAQQRQQFEEEKKRVTELGKMDSGDVYTEIGTHLGTYFENMAKIEALFDEEERKSKEVYTGTESIGKRALQRVLIRTKLQHMEAELREIMVYQCPPELGDLYTRVQAMCAEIKKEQAKAIAEKAVLDRIRKQKRDRKVLKMKTDIALLLSAIFMFFFILLVFDFVVQDRIEKYPQLGTSWIPKGELQRQYDALPKKYTGR